MLAVKRLLGGLERIASIERSLPDAAA